MSVAEAMKLAANMFPPLKDPQWQKLKNEHKPIVEAEMEGTTPEEQERTAGVLERMMAAVGGMDPVLRAIDWDAELAQFSDLPYPSYYLLPFHSALGGWLSQSASLFNRSAMDAIFEDNHPQKCLGVREELAKLVPRDANLVVDIGGGDCDGPSCVARQLPRCRVIVVECSPFMIIVGRRINAETLAQGNIEYKHALGEATGLEGGKADAVTITLVFHECSDEGKDAIMKEVFRLLRPGGMLLLTDGPPSDFFTYRGFVEPWKDHWKALNVEKFLSGHGFTDITASTVTEPPPGKTGQKLITWCAKKASAKL